MIAWLRCDACGTTGWARGQDDPSVNAFDLTSDPRWDEDLTEDAFNIRRRLLALRRNCNGEDVPSCEHEEFTITETEWPGEEYP